MQVLDFIQAPPRLLPSPPRLFSLIEVSFKIFIMKVSNALLTFTIATAYSANAAPSLEPPHAEDTLSEQPAPVPTSLVVQEIHVFPEIHMIPEDKDKDATKPTEFLKRSLVSKPIV